MIDRPWAAPRRFVAGVALIQLACGAGQGPAGSLTFAGSAVGREGEILRRQLASFEVRHPGVHVELRSVPDAADQQHQLYVQWLNARASEPDVLQLDVIATPEFAAAGSDPAARPLPPGGRRLLPADDRGESLGGIALRTAVVR